MTHNIEVESGKTVKLPTAGKYCDRDIKVTGFGSNEADLQAKYDEGVAAGEETGAAICAAKHFVHSFVGDGSGSASFYVPFEPDALQIFALDPTAHLTIGGLMTFLYDRRAFGMFGGIFAWGNNSTTIRNAAMTTKSALTRYSRSEDGVVTISDIYNSIPVFFASGYIYTVVAVKCTEQTDKELITAFVEGLTGSGTVTLNQEKVNAAFTDDEWAALIATKPGWTFTWI